MTHQRRPNSAFSWCGKRPTNFTFVDDPTCSNCKKAAAKTSKPRWPPKTHLQRPDGFTLCSRDIRTVALAPPGEAPTCRPCKGAVP